MQKTWKIILTVSIITNLILGFILVSKYKDPNISTEKIDSLESEISTLQNNRDSLKNSIDTITIEIGNNESNYEKVRDIIITNSVSKDYLFFTEYLEQNRRRLDSISNP